MTVEAPYTPPAYNAGNRNFVTSEAYTPPAYNAGNVSFTTPAGWASISIVGPFPIASGAMGWQPNVTSPFPVITAKFGWKFKVYGPSPRSLGADPDLGDALIYSPFPIAHGTIQVAAQNTVVAPFPVATGRLGWRTRLKSPVPTSAAYSEWLGHWSVLAMAPFPVVAGILTAGAVLSSATRSPFPVAHGRFGWRLKAVSPAVIGAGASTWTAGVLHGNTIGPFPFAAGTMVYPVTWSGTVVGPFPFVRVPLHGRVYAPVPIAAGSLSQVFTVNREAYVFTLSPDGSVAATTRYPEFPFTEVMRGFDGKFLLFGPDGLYEMTGDDDDGAPIESSFTTGTLDLGHGSIARLVEMWLRTRVTAGAVSAKVITDETRADEYQRAWRAGSLLQAVPIRFGQGRLASSYVLRISNVDGGSLGVENMEFLIDVAPRKVA
jgi:hypothetical protein